MKGKLEEEKEAKGKGEEGKTSIVRTESPS